MVDKALTAIPFNVSNVLIGCSIASPITNNGLTNQL